MRPREGAQAKRREHPAIIRTALVFVSYMTGAAAVGAGLPDWLVYGPILIATATIIAFTPPQQD